MENVSIISQYDLYFFLHSGAQAILERKDLVDVMVTASLGKGWAPRLESEALEFRDAVETVIKETAETADAIRRVEQWARNVSQWRSVAVGLARNAPEERRDVLIKASGWGAGRARTVKEMKDLLLTVKGGLSVHEHEFQALGMAPALLTLPERILAKLEGGATDMAREKAEDSQARAHARALFKRITTAVNVIWRSADVMADQASLLSQQDDASAAEQENQQAIAREATELSLHLEKILGEARVQARKEAASKPLPADLTDAEDDDTDDNDDELVA